MKNPAFKIPLLISLGIHLFILILLSFVIIYKSFLVYKITQVELMGTTLKPQEIFNVKYKEEKTKLIDKNIFNGKEEISENIVFKKNILPLTTDSKIKIPIQEEKQLLPQIEKQTALSEKKISFSEEILPIKENGKKKLLEDFDIRGPIAESERKILKFYYPQYPDNLQVEVKIELKFWVEPDGTVSKIIPLKRGEMEMEILAIEALQKWLFEPLPLYSHQEVQWGILTLKFKLK